MSEDRRLRVLRAIVQDYVQTSEPVGSKALLERHHLGVSAATVRNDMAALEEEGLIAAPHTSAGRVPTDAGYRLFVDRLSAVKPMSAAEQRAIAQFLEGAVDLDDVVDRTVRLLASLTRQVAVVQYPSLARSSVRHVELVPIGGERLLVVLITTTGPGRAAGHRRRHRPAHRRRREAPCRPCVPSSTGPPAGAPSPRRPPSWRRCPSGSTPPCATSCARSAPRSRTPSSRSARSASCSPAPPTWPGSAPTSR